MKTFDTKNHHLINATLPIKEGSHKIRLIASVKTNIKTGQVSVETDGLSFSTHIRDEKLSVTIDDISTERLKELGNLFLNAAKQLEDLTKT